MCVYYDTTGLIRGPHSWTNQCDILYCISIVILGSAIIMRTFESGMHCAVRVLSNEHGLTVRHCLQLFNHIESLNCFPGFAQSISIQSDKVTLLFPTFIGHHRTITLIHLVSTNVLSSPASTTGTRRSFPSRRGNSRLMKMVATW